MRNILIVTFTASLLLLSAASGQAEHHGGRGWGPGWGPVIGLGVGLGLWELSHPYYPYGGYDYYSPPVIIQQQPADVYIQQAPEKPREPAFWYYCQDPQGYYPYVKRCPNGWMKVVPTPPAAP